MVRSCGMHKKLLGRIEKVKRYEIIRGLESIQEMSDKEIECNANLSETLLRRAMDYSVL